MSSHEVAMSPLLSNLLSSNYDADLRPCLRTLLKLLDNIISQPDRAAVRTIRLGNRAFAGKVGRCRGAVDLLVDGCGFERRISGNSSSGIGGIGGGSTSTATGEPDLLVLPPPDEDQDQNQTAQMVRLVSARHLLAAAAVRDLGMDAAADLPPYQGPPPQPQRGGGGSSSASNHGSASTPFDPYQARRTATGAAAASAGSGGAGNSNSTGDASTLSRTEKELRALQAKRERLEKRLQKLGPGGRAVTAYRPGSTGTGNGGTIPPTSSGNGGGNGHTSASSNRGDGSLLASRMKRLEEERKKREDGGFTTRAMRDLESIKKAKVYTHAALRIGFADGCYVTARFLPSETVEAVRAVLKEECFREDDGRGLDLDFDLYVAPPRRRLDAARTLEAEGLVPAARVHVSWKVGGSPPPPGRDQPPGSSYLRDDLFRNTDGGAAGEMADGTTPVAFPDARRLVEDGAADNNTREGGKKRPAGNVGGTASAESREEALMARMLGKKPGLLPGGRGGDAGKKKSGSGGGKPKWLK